MTTDRPLVQQRRLSKKFAPFVVMAGVALGALAGSAHGESAGENESAKKATKNRFAISNHYVHNWVSMPSFTAKKVGSDLDYTFTPKRGEASVVVFLASWCLPCQRLIEDFKKLETAYRDRHTKFIYVFSGDTAKDARGFVEAYKLGDNTVIANIDLLAKYHQPELPSIYVGDRQTWLTLRYLSTTREDLGKLDDFLSATPASRSGFITTMAALPRSLRCSFSRSKLRSSLGRRLALPVMKPLLVLKAPAINALDQSRGWSWTGRISGCQRNRRLIKS